MKIVYYIIKIIDIMKIIMKIIIEDKSLFSSIIYNKYFFYAKVLLFAIQPSRNKIKTLDYFLYAN